MEQKTLKKEGNLQREPRYFISSLPKEIETMSRAVSGHWSMEMVSEYTKNGRIIYKKSTVIHEKETICDQFKTN